MTVWNGHLTARKHTERNCCRSSFPTAVSRSRSRLYAVEDCSAILRRKTNLTAIVIDFFSGSGTTAHAVMRLNKQDGGRRQCISVTNNEVAADEQKALREKGLRPGDPEWERWGICEYITKPRIEAAITGKTPDGEPDQGRLQVHRRVPDGRRVSRRTSSSSPSPTKRPCVSPPTASSPRSRRCSGCAPAPEDGASTTSPTGWDVADTYGVLANLDHTEDFLQGGRRQRRPAPSRTSSPTRTASSSPSRRSSPTHVEPVRLYEAYLRNFEIESGRGAL